VKRLLVFVLIFAWLAGCDNKPLFTDNGNSGQIKVVAFYDDNHNGTMDSNETGAQVKMTISQDVSCPSSSLDKDTILNTSADGVALFMNLKPGKYCVAPGDNLSMTTKMTQDVYVSSDMISEVMFGVVKP
jgi:hypothetical protein